MIVTSCGTLSLESIEHLISTGARHTPAFDASSLS
jgi:hypothetical protein